MRRVRGAAVTHTKDAEAAGRYCVDFIERKRKWAQDAPIDYIYWLARCAGHWGNKALDQSSRSSNGYGAP